MTRVSMRVGTGGPDLRVFLQSGPNCWSPLPGSGRREAKQLLCLHVVREKCRGNGTLMELWITSHTGRCWRIAFTAGG
jgi:hypothetical protein